MIPKVLPSPDGSKTADKVLAEYFREAGETSLPLIGFNEKLERRMELQEVMDRIETEKRLIEQELKMYLGEAAYAENELYRVSWKPVCSNRLDEKRLKEELPEVYNRYKRPIMSRRFMVKAAKEAA